MENDRNEKHSQHPHQDTEQQLAHCPRQATGWGTDLIPRIELQIEKLFIAVRGAAHARPRIRHRRLGY
ncbi:hypothetical protein EVAR_39295_1 [Eumeta japonica]|uniref:Uncharacterized protein n=1 Tax=Eumeta variegata TaxID=151549 RepID=A0A4C1VZH0_EUMVA|nr:hypothetical protein EVAR_39295_1 [Eumeta japonica]